LQKLRLNLRSTERQQELAQRGLAQRQHGAQSGRNAQHLVLLDLVHDQYPVWNQDAEEHGFAHVSSQSLQIRARDEARHKAVRRAQSQSRQGRT
jgi:hypothetical protein